LDYTLIVIIYFTCTSIVKDNIGRTTLGLTQEELSMLKTLVGGVWLICGGVEPSFSCSSSIDPKWLPFTWFFLRSISSAIAFYNFPFNARTCATKGRNDIEKSLKSFSKITRLHANMNFCTNISPLHLWRAS
jgi:hypothetical protein